MKRIVYAFFALIFMIFSVIIPDFSSFAAVVIPADDNTHFYFLNHYQTEEWTEADFLTKENYDQYYTTLTGTEKTDIVNKFVVNTSDSAITAIINDMLYPDYVAQNLNFSNCFFTPVLYNSQPVNFDETENLIAYIRTGSSEFFAFYEFFCPSGKDLVISGNTVYCEDEFYFTYTPFRYTTFIDNNVYHNSYSLASIERLTSSFDSSHSLYYTTINTSVYEGTVFCTMPYLFTSNTISDINTDYNSYNSYVNGVSYAIDRRTEKFINALNGVSDDENILNDVDLMQFEGDLGFEYFDFKGYITENQGLIFPNYIVNYKLNNYTDLRKENIEIYADYSFDFKLTFQMAGNQMYGYQSANMGTMGFMDMLPVNQNNYGMDLNAYMDDNTFVNYRETSGLHLQSNGIRDYENIQNFNSNSMIADFGRYFYQIMNNVSANKVVNSKRDSYFYITCEFWIEYVDENGRRVQSDKIIRKIDYWGDSSDPSSNLTPVITDIDSSGIIDDNQAYHDFIDSYNYKKINDETDGYLNYLPSTSNNSNQSSVGDITIYQNPYPYVLVDIPENEWMNYTPNLKMLLTDFKTMLAETKEGSVLNMLPATYNYFPAPFMQYMLYGIGIIIMIGIWRAITRR